MATMFKSDLPKRKKVVNRTISRARAAKRSQSETLKRDVYALVDERDGMMCRCCGSWQPYFHYMHRHHITFRSQGGKHTTANIVSVCERCHRWIHERRITVTGNADQTLTFTTKSEAKCL